MAAAASSLVAGALARMRREPFADLRIAEHLDQLCRDAQHVWRDTRLTPLVTLRLFALQILHGNTAITHLRQLSGVDFAPASYCEARQRLPLGVVTALLSRTVQWAGQQLAAPLRSIGPRVLIVDGSSFSMGDTPELRGHFGLPARHAAGRGLSRRQAPGAGRCNDGTVRQHARVAAVRARHASGRAAARAMLRMGDILLGDRAFCSYAHVALLNAAGVFACFRLHQKRKTAKTRGIERWRRPKRPPVWMTPQQWRELPARLDVRLVRYTIAVKGRRTRHVVLATTLLDEQLWPDAKLAQLYGRRWEIETCFDHLKTTMRMNVLKCQSVDGVLKELAVYLLVYNLVRLAMLRQARARGTSAARISFVDALRWVCCRMLGLCRVAELLINPRRPGRHEPRVIRRRLKEYDLMKRPRAELKWSEQCGKQR